MARYLVEQWARLNVVLSWAMDTPSWCGA